MKFDKRYVRLIEDLNWLKSDISSLVRLRCFSVARVQMKRLNRLLFIKSYVENLGCFPQWLDEVLRIY